MKIVLLGAPGSGKGTHAQRLISQLNIPQISTGDIFRKNIKENTELGMQVKEILAKGQLVPDAVTVAIVKDRLAQPDCANGYILDGFPRSIVQAEELSKIETIDYAINIDVDNATILKRLTGRRFCPSCNGTFHISWLESDACPTCGKELIIREDDREETILKRLDAYYATTAPLADFYADKATLVTVDGTRDIDDLQAELIEILTK